VIRNCKCPPVLFPATTTIRLLPVGARCTDCRGTAPKARRVGLQKHVGLPEENSAGSDESNNDLQAWCGEEALGRMASCTVFTVRSALIKDEEGRVRGSGKSPQGKCCPVRLPNGIKTAIDSCFSGSGPFSSCQQQEQILASSTFI
jgi:hypothetical protein